MDFIYDPSMVLYLPLCEPDGTTFSSGDTRGHLCTATGTEWRPDGRYFNGVDDYINCGHHPGLDIINTLTILAWIKPAVFSDYMTFIAKGDFDVGDRVTYALQCQQTTGKLYFYFKGGGANFAFIGTTGLTADKWEMVGVTMDWDTDAVVLYRSGDIDASGSLTGAPVPKPAEDLAIGCRIASGVWEQGFMGGIGEVMIYNRVLTPLEIQQKYLATKWRYK